MLAQRYRLLLPGVLASLILFGCSRTTSPPNQRQPLTSPSEKFVLTVPIEERSGYDARVWQVTISAGQGEQLYQDHDSEFVGNLQVYWVWDKEDRVWLYNSDTSEVFYWELTESEWVKVRWGYGRTKEVEGDLKPPSELYPS